MSGASHGTPGARVQDGDRQHTSGIEGGNGWDNLGSKFQKAQDAHGTGQSVRVQASDVSSGVFSNDTKEGFLMKKSSNVFSIKRWQRRWFQITGDRISYTESVEDASSTFKTIKIENVGSCAVKSGQIFEIVTKLYIDSSRPKVYQLRAKNPEETEDWVRCLQHNIRVYKRSSKNLNLSSHGFSPHGDIGDGDTAQYPISNIEEPKDQLTTESLRIAPGSEESLKPWRSDGGGSLNKDESSKSVTIAGTSGSSFKSNPYSLVRANTAQTVLRYQSGVDSLSGDLADFASQSSSQHGGTMAYDENTAAKHMVLSSTAKGRRGPGIHPGNVMPSILRKLVSKKKKRYVHNGFSLDLAYIMPQIIAMGFPSEGIEGSYRNSVSDVVQFFDTKHPNSYLIYNLCSERTYNYELFNNRVSYFPFKDHNPPPFEMMRPMCDSMLRWIKESDENVCAIHCKAGKGRTGVMIVAYLMHCGMFKTATEAIEFYGEKRTFDGKGVTIRSQQRYCRYFYQNLHMSRPLVALVIKAVHIYDMPEGVLSMNVSIRNGDLDTSVQKELDGFDFVDVQMGDIAVAGDVQMALTCIKSKTNSIKLSDFVKKKKNANDICSAWFHTSFIEGEKLVLLKEELDGPPKKDKKHEKFQTSFKVEIIFGLASITQISPGQDKLWGITLNDRGFESFTELHENDGIVPCADTGITRVAL